MALVKELEEYDCPYCMEKLYPPVFQCPNGHLFCEDCIDKYDRCPTCETSTVRNDPAGGHIRNLEIERIIRDYQTHKCPWDGCLKRLRLDNLEHHRLDCLKRSGKFCAGLKIPNCKKEVPLSGLLSHFEEKHNGSGHDKQCSSENFVVFRAKFPMEENRRPFRELFMCWIGNSSSIPFILMVTIRARTIYWSPFIITSKKGLLGVPVTCEIIVYAESKIDDPSDLVYHSQSNVQFLDSVTEEKKWSLNKSFCAKVAHFQDTLLTLTKIRTELQNNKPVEIDDHDYAADTDGSDSGGMDDDSDSGTESNKNCRGDKNALFYSIKVSFRDVKTGSELKVAIPNTHMVSVASPSVTRNEQSEPGTSKSTTNTQSCPK